MVVAVALTGELERRVAALFAKRKAAQAQAILDEGAAILAEHGVAAANNFLRHSRLSKQQFMELVIVAGLTVMEAEDGIV
jgi:hypothetical protein